MEISTIPTPAPEVSTTVTVQSQNGTKSKQSMEDLRGFDLLFCVTQLFGICSVIFVGVLTGHYGGGFAWKDPANLGKVFNWHPLLMTIGFIYLFGNSIMIYRALRNLRKYRLKLLHAGIHSAVIICVVIALVAAFDSHNLKTPPIPNLYTLHSWIGLMTVIIFCLQWALSMLVFLYPGASMTIRASAMPVHYFLGLVIFVCAVAAALTGLLEKAIWSSGDYSKLPPVGVLFNVTGLFFIVFAVLVVYIVTEQKFRRYPRPEDGALLNSATE